MASVIINDNSTVVVTKKRKEIRFPALKKMNETQEGFLHTIRTKGLISENELVMINHSYCSPQDKKLVN